MSEWKRNVKFWSRNLLENLGLIVVISFGIMVFLGLETSPETAGGMEKYGCCQFAAVSLLFDTYRRISDGNRIHGILPDLYSSAGIL